MKASVALLAIVRELDDQVALWDALHNHCEKYLSAIVACMDRQSSVSTGITSCVGHMKDVSTLLTLSQYQTLQNLFLPLKSSLVKLKKVQIAIEALSTKAQTTITKESEQAGSNYFLSPWPTFYLDLIESFSREYKQEYNRVKILFSDLPKANTDEARQAVLDNYQMVPPSISYLKEKLENEALNPTWSDSVED